MTTHYAPVFLKDGNEYILPGSEIASRNTVEEAKAAGAEANLQNTYGLVATGDVVSLEDGQYEGPYIVATVGDKQAWIIGGPTLDELMEARHSAVENHPSSPPGSTTSDEDDDSTGLIAAAASVVAEALSETLSVDPTPEPPFTFSGGGGTDGAGAGGSI